MILLHSPPQRSSQQVFTSFFLKNLPLTNKAGKIQETSDNHPLRNFPIFPSILHLFKSLVILARPGCQIKGRPKLKAKALCHIFTLFVFVEPRFPWSQDVKILLKCTLHCLENLLKFKNSQKNLSRTWKTSPISH